MSNTHRRLTVGGCGALACVVVALTLAACGDDRQSPAATPTLTPTVTPTPETPRYLFLLYSDAGELQANPDGSYVFRLKEVWDTVVAFTDRPFRDVISVPLHEWIAGWNGNGFGDNPPNAAITMLVDGTVQETDWAVMTLRNPRFTDSETLEFDSEFLRLPDGTLAFFPTVLGSGVKPAFLTTQVFIDSTGAVIPPPDQPYWEVNAQVELTLDLGPGGYTASPGDTLALRDPQGRFCDTLRPALRLDLPDSECEDRSCTIGIAAVAPDRLTIANIPGSSHEGEVSISIHTFEDCDGAKPTDVVLANAVRFRGTGNTRTSTPTRTPLGPSPTPTSTRPRPTATPTITPGGPTFTATATRAPGECSVPTPAGAAVLPPGDGEDIVIDAPYLVGAGRYTYRYVNIVNGGALFFDDSGDTIDFRASSILVEQGGRIVAGSVSCPFGSNGGKLMIGLWGRDETDQGKNQDPSVAGIQCVGGEHPGQCFPHALADGKHFCMRPEPIDDWSPANPCDVQVDDVEQQHALGNQRFEGFHQALNFDYGQNVFGYKVFGVSYGGSVELFGRKGVADTDLVDPDARATACAVPEDQFDANAWAAGSGESWARLDQTAAAQQRSLTLDRGLSWESGDRAVVATTDWQPSHSELVEIQSATALPDTGQTRVTLESALAFPHYGEKYTVPAELRATSENPNQEVDVRGAVALLSRSIVIYSLGETADEPFPSADTPDDAWRACGHLNGSAPPGSCYFGGHVVVRQGFATFQVQGVELRQLGQGGRMGHYPVHFHHAKDTAYTNAFVKDSAIWDSMTRFIVLHGTHGVTLARNVGFLSMGHGFYLEDGSEIDNLLCHNLSISTRGSLQEYFEAQDITSPTYRFIPPILDRAADTGNKTCDKGGKQMEMCAGCEDSMCRETFTDQFTFGGDTLFPVAFWSMNAYNDFVGNKAVGVHGYGSCFWLLGSGVSGSSADPEVAWTEGTYADFNRAGGRQAPLKRFRGNACSTATHALQTTLQVAPGAPHTPDTTGFTPVANPYVVHNPNPDCARFAQGSCVDYVRPVVSGNFLPVKAGGTTCSQGVPSGSTFEDNAKYCVTTVIDRFTTSFNWAGTNFGAVWLRPQWYVFLNSAITDQLTGGLGFVSGGSWSQNPPGYFTLTKDSLFIGATQSDNPYASPLGPEIASNRCGGSVCSLPEDGVGLFKGEFNPKRLISIYDGPFFADGNIFAHIEPIMCAQTPPNPDLNAEDSCRIYSATIQPYDQTADRMRVINAAIGWKQPNIFYYPPAFAFRRSAFEGNTFRHNAIDQYEPYIQGNPATPDAEPKRYSPLSEDFDGAITPVDFSTILNDLDGTLTGWVLPEGTRTSSVSKNAFFDAPSQDAECLSFGVQTSPYEFVTSVVAPLAGEPMSLQVDPGAWMEGGVDAAVPIYRQLTLPTDECKGDMSVCCTPGQDDCPQEEYGCTRASFMVGGQTGEAPYLTVNGGVYYIDTHGQGVTCVNRRGYAPNFHVATFAPGKRYVIYQLFANENTRVTYQMQVGETFQNTRDLTWVRVFPHEFGTAGGNSLRVKEISDATTIAALNAGVSTPASGVVAVTIDNSAIADDFKLASRPLEESCLPRDLCTPNAERNACVLQQQDHFVSPNAQDRMQWSDVLADVCDYWVTAAAGRKHLPNAIGADADNPFLADCPAHGCLGVVVQLPADFSPKPYAEVGAPLVDCFDAGTWNVPMHSKLPDACPTPKPPDSNAFCPPEVP